MDSGQQADQTHGGREYSTAHERCTSISCRQEEQLGEQSDMKDMRTPNEIDDESESLGRALERRRT